MRALALLLATNGFSADSSKELKSTVSIRVSWVLRATGSPPRETLICREAQPADGQCREPLRAELHAKCLRTPRAKTSPLRTGCPPVEVSLKATFPPADWQCHPICNSNGVAGCCDQFRRTLNDPLHRKDERTTTPHPLPACPAGSRVWRLASSASSPTFAPARQAGQGRSGAGLPSG